MALTALARILFDNHANCKFDQILLDATTFCFINDCTYFGLMSHIAENWPEALYAVNMIWTTVASGIFIEDNLETDYKYYYQLGESIAILIDDVLSFKP